MHFLLIIKRSTRKNLLSFLPEIFKSWIKETELQKLKKYLEQFSVFVTSKCFETIFLIIAALYGSVEYEKRVNKRLPRVYYVLSKWNCKAYEASWSC